MATFQIKGKPASSFAESCADCGKPIIGLKIVGDDRVVTSLGNVIAVQVLRQGKPKAYAHTSCD